MTGYPYYRCMSCAFEANSSKLVIGHRFKYPEHIIETESDEDE